MTLIQAIDIFIEKRISALPIVNESKQIIDVYSKSDVFVSASSEYFVFKSSGRSGSRSSMQKFYAEVLCRSSR